ncbi:hypothetical protein P344_06345 [Spiroplasma mirum ATCC 29335]|uniref:Aminotransferase class I/classII domain-containing protein n=1 Tax=Spiroplasma mirum ATCC 29335 TaxID=838561 RepID=W6AN08_9MOLU|nr:MULTISPECIES: hypothetical protein [Spiroplasma]AHI58572.1 hypothetical protein P344_06345 [Spiroplasma mirum ATCC 29335]
MPKPRTTAKNLPVLSKNWLYESDIFGTEVTKAVYSIKGAKWIDKLHLVFQENYKIIECFIRENHLPLTIMAMPSSFATVILINNDKKTLEFYKKRFFQEKLLVKFNDDFYDLKNKWFRLVLSCSNKTINKFLIRLKRIFK